MSTGLVILILIALSFDFMNGFNDCASIVASLISSRTLTPRSALALVALAEFAGPFLFGVAVATTIGHDVIVWEAFDTALLQSAGMTPQSLALVLIVSALLAAVSWDVLTWYLGIPSSSSHALVGGLIGAALAANATLHQFGHSMDTQDLYEIARVLRLQGLGKVIMALVLSPPLGFLTGYFLLKAIKFVFRGATPGVNRFFRKSQVVTGICLALSHGTNDSQKTMGVISMALLSFGLQRDFYVPLWVMAMCAGTIAIGAALGGWRIIRTLGGKIFRIRPVHGFDIQVSSAAVILGASLTGGPVSTTHVISSAVMGAGSAERFSKVRWGVGRQLLLAWFITIPSTAILAGILNGVLMHVV